jgi:hypothetical protein
VRCTGTKRVAQTTARQVLGSGFSSQVIPRHTYLAHVMYRCS